MKALLLVISLLTIFVIVCVNEKPTKRQNMDEKMIQEMKKTKDFNFQVRFGNVVK